MTGIEKLREWANELREAARAYRDGEIGYVPLDMEACQRKNAARLDAIADQIEREIDDAVADEVADTLSAYEMNTNARWYSAVEDGAESDCRAEYEMISRYWLPRPRFEDGEVVQIGDKAMFHGTEQEVDSYSVTQGGDALINSIVNCFWLSHKGRAKRPEPPKVLDADGVEFKVGDEVWMVRDGDGPWTVESVDDGRVTCLSYDLKLRRYAKYNVFTHKRPEPEDTWEELEKCSKDPCEYFGGNKNCKECPVELGNVAWSCTKAMAKDLVRRCKALAGVE